MTTIRQKNFSIIIPTFQEAQNVTEMVKRISAIDVGDHAFELIFVDDNSQDGIVETVQKLQAQFPWVKLIVRTGKRSLSLAVIEGLQNAKYPIVISLDADLSHPPEKIPELVALLTQPGTDFVIGSRYAAGGTTDEVWPLTRKIGSRILAWTARMLLSADVRDPLSGFWGTHKSVLLAGAPLNPIGWRTGLEIMMKCRCKNIKEVTIHFSERHKGNSKLNLKTIFNDLRHINRLMFYKITSGSR